MPFWGKLKRKKTGLPIKKLGKPYITPELEPFVADILASGRDILIKANEIGTDGAGELPGYIFAKSTTPSTITDVIRDKWGGGLKEFRFFDHDDNDRLIMREDDPMRPLKIVKQIQGEPKGKKKEEKEKEKAKPADFGDLVQAIFKPEIIAAITTGITSMVTLFTTMIGQKQVDPVTLAREMAQMIKSLEPEIPNFLEMTRSVMGLFRETADLFKTPPVTQGGGGWFESLVREGVRGAMSAPGVSNALSGLIGGQSQIPQQAGSAGLAGTGMATAQTPQTQQAEPAWSNSNPLRDLKDMLYSGQDPDIIGAFIVEAIDHYAKFGKDGIPSQFRFLLDDPASAADTFLSFVPGLNASYLDRVKKSAIKHIDDWNAQNKPVEDQDATHFTPQSDTEQPPAPEDQGDGPGEPDDDEDAAPVGAKH